MNKHESEKMQMAIEILTTLLGSMHPETFAKALVVATNDGCIFSDEDLNTENNQGDEFIQDWHMALNELVNAGKNLKGNYKKIYDIYLEVVMLSDNKDAEKSYDAIFYGEKTISLQNARQILKQAKVRKEKAEAAKTKATLSVINVFQ